MLAKHAYPRSTELRWCDYAEAYSLLRFDSNKIALWELNLRISI